ncbi:site-specific integrase [Magnetospirillum sp. UT-4]|uniref:tyrosine-type recombinase/integrase n=1 Tax=Magnetospirillum sp. UT-4 TaxID=2681467 RepID=UPI001385FD13|nr:site-specific integrase [Magnetospirillum sp. UT-4]CAA7625027.1 Integrase family protein [Magnetospirillum sp. UT-4]
MGRAVRDSKLETRAARARLEVCHKPYWRVIDNGCHIGYRKGERGGVWRARLSVGNGRYVEQVIGAADDIRDADGLSVFSFGQAQERARDWFLAQTRRLAGLPATQTRGYTVADVMRDYLDWYRSHRKSVEATRFTIDGHILPALGSVEVSALTPAQIREFHEKLAAAPARLRRAPGKASKFRPAPRTDEEKRRRRSSANRVLTVLKAALNHAYAEGRIASDDCWRRVKPFRAVDAARVHYLSEGQCRALAEACDPEFRLLVQAAILTGCRYSELVRLRVGDVNADSGTLLVAEAKSGKSRHVVLTEEGQDFFAKAVSDKAHGDLLFTKPGGGAWGKSHQCRPLRDACAAAGIVPSVTFHALRHTHASHLAMRGTPLVVIAAQLGHSDTRMVEKHYAHLAPSYVAETIRKGFPRLGLLLT